jgi:hypothetical protein
MSEPSDLHAVQESLLQLLGHLNGPLSVLRLEKPTGDMLKTHAPLYQRMAAEQKAAIIPVWEAARAMAEPHLPTLRAVRSLEPVSSWRKSYPSAADAILSVTTRIIMELMKLESDAESLMKPEYQEDGWTWEDFKRPTPPDDDQIDELRTHLMQEIAVACSGEKSAPQFDFGARNEGYLSPADLANSNQVNVGTLESRLRRWRENNPQESGRGWFENQDASGRMPRYLYRASSVAAIVTSLKNKTTGE